MNLTDLTEKQRAQALHHLRGAARARAMQWDHEREIEQLLDREIDDTNDIITTLAGAVDGDAEDLDPGQLTFITEEDLATYCEA
jgi:hypothetical protein